MHTPTITPLRDWAHPTEQHDAERESSPAGLARFIAAALRWYRMRRDVRRLMAFDDRMLEDIGLSRAEIEGAARAGRDWV